MGENEVTEILRALGRLEGKMDGMRTEQGRINEVVENQNARIGAVEVKVGGVLGWAAGAGAIAAFVVAVISALF